MIWLKRLGVFQARLWLWLLLAGVVSYVGYETHDLNRQIALAHHQSELNLIRSGLLEAWVHYQVQPSNHTNGDLSAVNPLRLMVLPDVKYGGEFDHGFPEVKETWLFDRQQKCLVYVFSDGGVAAYRLVSVFGQDRATLAAGGWDLQIVKGYQKRGA